VFARFGEIGNTMKTIYSVIFVSLSTFSMMSSADAQQSGEASPGIGEFGIEIGAFIFLGSDFQVFYRPKDSQWVFGYRRLETEEDFFDEAAFGFAGDDSDTETLSKSGPFLRYLFDPERPDTYYLSGALFKSTQKIECGAATDEDSANSIYLGGGFMGRRDQTIGYNFGILIAPGETLETNTPLCSIESEGGFDINLSLVFRF